MTKRYAARIKAGFPGAGSWVTNTSESIPGRQQITLWGPEGPLDYGDDEKFYDGGSHAQDERGVPLYYLCHWERAADGFWGEVPGDRIEIVEVEEDEDGDGNPIPVEGGYRRDLCKPSPDVTLLRLSDDEAAWLRVSLNRIEGRGSAADRAMAAELYQRIRLVRSAAA